VCSKGNFDPGSGDGIDGFLYVESDSSSGDIDASLDGYDVGGTVLMNAGGGVGGLDVQNGSVGGDVCIKTHGDAADVDVSSDGATVSGNVEIKTDGDADVSMSDATIEGSLRIDANGDVSVSGGTVDGGTNEDATVRFGLSEPPVL